MSKAITAGKDRNGNKVIYYATPKGSFSIQTNGNLPYCHSNYGINKKELGDVD